MKKPVRRHDLELLEGRILLDGRPFEDVVELPFIRPGQEIEPNDTIETATPLEQFLLGMPCRIEADGVIECPPGIFQGAGTLGSPGAPESLDADVDFFSFPAAAGDRIALRVSGPAIELGATIELVAANGSVIGTATASDGANDGAPHSAVLEVTVENGGEFFVRVGSDGGEPSTATRSTAYEIGVSVRPDRHAEHEPNDSFETANEIALTRHTLQLDVPTALPMVRPQFSARGFIRGELGNGETFPDTDFFRFDAWPNLEIEVSSSGTGAHGGHLTIYDQDKNVVGEAAPDADGNLSFSFESTYEGPYFAQLTDMETVVCITTPCLTYELRVDERREFVDPFVEHEPNDDFATANHIELHNVVAQCATRSELPNCGIDTQVGFVRGSLENGEVSPDTDFYQIAVGANSAVGVRAFGAGAHGGHLTVYDHERNVIADADPNAEGVLAARFESTEGTRFFIQLTDAGNVVCITTPCLTYELHVTARHEVVDPFAEQEPNDTLDTANPMQQVWPRLLMIDGQPGDPTVADVVTTALAEFNSETGEASGGETGLPGEFADIELRPIGDVICLAIGCGDPWRDRPTVYFARGDFTTPTDAADEDYFSFSAGANSRLALNYGGLADGAIELLDADGIVLARTTSEPRVPAENEGDPATGETNVVRDTFHASINFFTAAGGTFYVHLGLDPDGAPHRASDYRLRVAARHEPNFEHEPNDTLDTANRIKLRGRFDWPCNFVCPLADASGVVADPTETDGPNDETAAGVELRPIRWPGDETLHGFINGELEFATCPPEMVCIAVVRHGVDNFVFDVPAGQLVSVRLTGPLVRNNGVLTLLNSDGGVLTADDDNSDGLAVEWRTRAGGTFYARVTAGFPTVELQVASAVNCNPLLTGSLCASPWAYRVDVTAEPLPNPIEGKDEHEPNDTIEQANHLELRRDGSDKSGVVFRERVAHGIAGGPTHDVDFFSFEARPGEDVTVGLGCVPGFDLQPIVIQPGDREEPPIDLPEPITTPVLVVVVFDSEGSEIGRTGIDGSENVLFQSDSGGVYYAMMTLEGGAPDAEPTPYELHIHTRRLDLEGRDEQEPNDTIEQANELPLHVFPTFAPGIELRGGDASGIAGGPTGDVDAFEFMIEAGEHVTVDVQGLVFDGVLPRPIQIWLDENGLDEFGDPAGTTHGGPRGRNVQPADPIQSILEKHPDLEFGNFVVTVFDSAGNEIGSSASSDSGAVTFDSATGGAYFAVVSAAESSASDRPAHYRLGVIARSDFDPEKVDPNDPNAGTGEGGEEINEEPFVVVLGPRGSFEYTDENGDNVVIQFRGSSGKATITFTDSEADGSDIASIDIEGVRKNGSLSIHTVGSAEVGEIAIHGMTSGAAGARRRGGGRSASFGTIDVDGNVGQVTSDMNIRALVVDGMLGDLDAHNRQIGEVRAETFDAALANVGSIRLLTVESNTEDEMFASLLPWEDPA